MGFENIHDTFGKCVNIYQFIKRLLPSIVQQRRARQLTLRIM